VMCNPQELRKRVYCGVFSALLCASMQVHGSQVATTIYHIYCNNKKQSLVISFITKTRAPILSNKKFNCRVNIIDR
jgi:hypothetical protein